LRTNSLEEDGVIVVTLEKGSKGETWSAAIKGHGNLDPMSQEDEKKKLMLMRFQEEVREIHLSYFRTLDSIFHKQLLTGQHQILKNSW
jgi:hypothetical protein